MGKIHKKLSKSGFVELQKLGISRFGVLMQEIMRLKYQKMRKWYFFEISWTVVYATVEIL